MVSQGEGVSFPECGPLWVLRGSPRPNSLGVGLATVRRPLEDLFTLLARYECLKFVQFVACLSHRLSEGSE